MKVTGKMVKLYVGNYQHKFLLQDTKWAEVFLTHYDSGVRLGSLTPVKLANYKSYHSITDREAAKLLIETLVKVHGADTFNAKLKATTVIN